MPLDPNVRSMLDALAGRPKAWQLTPLEAREGAVRLFAAMEPKNVAIGKIAIGKLPGPVGEIAFRSYTPASAMGKPSSGLVFFHGGFFVLGNLDTHDAFCRLLANESGCRVIAIDYRLAPEARFPAAVEDARAATMWVSEHAAELEIDGNRLGVCGDSAGGNLAAVVCQLSKEIRPKIALQVLFCPLLDPAGETESRDSLAEGYLLETKSLAWAMTHYTRSTADLSDPRVAPLRAADLSGLPPAHIHTAEFDPLRDEGKAYADRLERSGVEVRYTCHEGMIHNFYGFANAIPYAWTALRAAGNAIKSALQ